MNYIELVGIVVTALVVPYVVALIRSKTITGDGARWLAIGVSVLAGVVTALAAGVPATPVDWLVCIGLAVGAVQFAYTAFKSVGVTCGWLEALQGLPKDMDASGAIKKNQALVDKAEERVRKSDDGR